MFHEGSTDSTTPRGRPFGIDGGVLIRGLQAPSDGKQPRQLLFTQCLHILFGCVEGLVLEIGLNGIGLFREVRGHAKERERFVIDSFICSPYRPTTVRCCFSVCDCCVDCVDPR